MPQQNKDPNAESSVDGNHERQPSPQSPDDGAAAKIVGEEATNNEQRRNARPFAQINRDEGFCQCFTTCYTILEFPTITVPYFTRYSKVQTFNHSHFPLLPS